VVADEYHFGWIDSAVAFADYRLDDLKLDDLHFNELGHKLIAEAVEAEVMRVAG
jgi:lysophospholipase L1-like esterase